MQAFYDTWALSGEQATEAEADFAALTDRVAATAVDAEIMPKITSVAKMLHWRYFAEQGEPLPSGVALIDGQGLNGNGESGIQTVEAGVDVSPIEFTTIVRQFKKAGLSTIGRSRIGERSADGRIERIADSYTAALAASPYVSFLRSLGGTTTQPTERTLNQFEKMYEVANAESTIRREHGLQPTADLRLHHAANVALGRRLFDLDDRTIVDAQEAKTDIAAARAFVMQAVNEYAASQPGGMDSETQRHSKQIAKDGAANGLLREFTTDLHKRLSMGSEFRAIDSSLLMHEFTRRLFSDQATTLNAVVDQSIEAIEPSVLPYLYDESSLSIEQLLVLRGVNLESVPRVNYYVGMADGRDQDPMFYDFPTQAISFDASARVMSKAEYDKREAHVLGSVTRAPELRDDQPRLLYERSSNSADFELPKAVDRADLVLEFKVFEAQTTPVIPGYDLVAVDFAAHRFAFAKAADDEYKPANVPIPDGGRAPLAALLHSYDLRGVDELITQPNLTAEDVRSFLMHSSDYTFDTTLADGIGSQHGRLQLQCDGAAIVLRRALKAGFGYSSVASTYILNGLVLAPDTVLLTANAHAQVEFIFGKGIYMMDATPGLSGGSTVSEKAVTRGGLRRIFASRKQKAKEEDRADGEVPKIAAILEFDLLPAPRVTPEELRDLVELRLSPILKVAGRTALYEVAKDLPGADPLRRTLETTLQLANGRAAENAAEKLKTYIANVEKADEGKLKQMGLKTYEPLQFAVMRELADQLSSLT
jgi:hypothetical protein